jgi:GT2 family glycosyltransferase
LVYLIIPNYNGITYLGTCLSSLGNQTFRDFKIIIVDNGSNDYSVEFINENYPEVEVIKLTKNFGFAKSVNIGIKRALEDKLTTHIVLLNNDIECDNEFLNELLCGFISPDVASVCPKMLNYYKKDVIDNTGDFVKKRGFPYMRGKGEKDTGQYDNLEFVFGTCAGASIYKREVFEKIGLFDEDYFAFLEDVDLSFKLQYQGFKCVYNPKAVCYHVRGGTIDSNKSYHIYLLERNLFALRVINYPISILIIYSIYYQLARIYRFLEYFFASPKLFVSAVKGFLHGLIMLPKSISKRNINFKNIIVDIGYIKSIMK